MNVFTIHDSFRRPNLWGSYHHVELQSIKNVVVSKTVEERLGEPYNKCVVRPDTVDKNAELIKKSIEVNHAYNRDMCYYLCFLRYLAEGFNCSYPDLFPTSFGESCIEKVKNVPRKNEKFDYGQMCASYCPMECHTTVYSFQASQLDNKSSLGVNSIRLNVDFDEFKFVRTTQFPKTTLADLISKIGGTLGLFIGLKALSFVEIFEFFVECLAVSGRKIKNKVFL